jgi:hypothetical protein
VVFTDRAQPDFSKIGGFETRRSVRYCSHELNAREKHRLGAFDFSEAELDPHLASPIEPNNLQSKRPAVGGGVHMNSFILSQSRAAESNTFSQSE